MQHMVLFKEHPRLTEFLRAVGSEPPKDSDFVAFETKEQREEFMGQYDKWIGKMEWETLRRLTRQPLDDVLANIKFDSDFERDLFIENFEKARQEDENQQRKLARVNQSKIISMNHFKRMGR